MANEEQAVVIEEKVVIQTKVSRLAALRSFWRTRKEIALMAIAIVVLAAISITLFVRMQQPKAAPLDGQSEIEALVAKVGQLIVLPAEEVPTVATITDPKLLKDQAFFANAQTGNKVLIYAQARKAILYDPLQHKIVEVAPINLGAAAPSPGGR